MKIDYGLFTLKQGPRQHDEDKWAKVLQDFLDQPEPMARITFEAADGVAAMAGIRSAYSALVQLLKRRDLSQHIWCKIRDNQIFLIRQ